MVFTCVVCNLTVNSEEQLNQHYAGAKHKNRAAGYTPQTAESRVAQVKSAGMNYFVKGGLSTQDQNDSNSMASATAVQGSAENNSDTYCATCRVNLTSASQAQTHYTGSKHHYKVNLLNAATKSQAIGNTSQVPYNNPDIFCAVCCVRLTSSAMAQMHYSGSKHQCKVKELNEPGPKPILGSAKPEVTVTSNSSDSAEFCYTCRMKFTSSSQAEMHYSGGKHKHRLLILEEAKNSPLTNTPDDSEPSVKKKKFLEVCETCNVKLTCPASAQNHYSGSKHAKKLAWFNGIGNNGTCAGAGNTSQFMSIQGAKRPIQANNKKRGGHLYCSFCDLPLNSQAQMDVHRMGSKHKAKVQQVSGPTNVLAEQVVKTMNTPYMMAGDYGQLSQYPPPPPPSVHPAHNPSPFFHY